MRIIEELKNDQFHSNVEINVNDYLGCCIEESKGCEKTYHDKTLFIEFFDSKLCRKSEG
jgi:hypothetical protein